MKFRKKPIVVEAVQATKREVIETPEGSMIAEPGDWIVTGPKGERYPCKPAVFHATYEPIEEKHAHDEGDSANTGSEEGTPPVTE